eukprot:TRINITY_DN1161_c0_g1_i2.p1 TRINITY_DN1161_c0_g1~~TRINITY_DN1161_c0_g1_i2.p1  ORF type:complete len:106 (+),score=53.87 TRINITY_DN1161_c0_g1_i2:58-375(+)
MSEVESQEMKGGHAPAQKVGGMRVVQHKTSKPEEKPAPKPTEEEVKEFGDEEKEKKEKEVVVSGAVTGEAIAYPKEAVKSFHEKPTPTHQMGASPKPKIIQQPKK